MAFYLASLILAGKCIIYSEWAATAIMGVPLFILWRILRFLLMKSGTAYGSPSKSKLADFESDSKGWGKLSTVHYLIFHKQMFKKEHYEYSYCTETISHTYKLSACKK